MMRVLSVRQPWAHAIMYWGKDIENRPKPVTGGHHGLVAIQAGKTYMPDAEAEIEARGDLAGTDWLTPWPVPLGAIIGVVDLIDEHLCSATQLCHRHADVLGWIRYDGADWLEEGKAICSNWAEVPDEPGVVIRHLAMQHPRLLAEPIPFRGMLGLRNLTADVEREVLARLA